MEVVSYYFKEFLYYPIELYVDDAGELKLTLKARELKQIAPISLLYFIEKNDNGKIIYSKPIEAANKYILHKKIVNNHKCVSIVSRGLLHYFSFIERENERRINNGKKEMLWNDMPLRNNEKPTYSYSAYLKKAYQSQDKETSLARSTCNAYMRVVVGFYQHLMSHGFKFNNPPFEYETITINIKSSYNSMQPMRRKVVRTTDLRLNLPKDQTINKNKRNLQSLSSMEWNLLDAILRKKRKVMVLKNGFFEHHKLAIEYTYIFLIMKWTGLRREEVLTLRSNMIFKPEAKQVENGYCDIDIGPHVGVSTKYGKRRTIEMPSMLMSELYDYVFSDRYISRAKKNIETLLVGNKESTFNEYLFLNNKGDRINAQTLNARWCEIKNTIKFEMKDEFTHKMHNLRSTYAVDRFIAFLNAGVDKGKSITYLQHRLGHDDIDTTLHYLKIAEDRTYDKKSGQEAFEVIIDYLFENENFKVKGDSEWD